MSHPEAIRKAICEAANIYGLPLDQVAKPLAGSFTNTAHTSAKRYVVCFLHWNTGIQTHAIAEALSLHQQTVLNWLNSESENKTKQLNHLI